MSRTTYITELSDAAWALLEPLFPTPKRRGSKRKHPWRQLVNATRYVIRSGASGVYSRMDSERGRRSSPIVESQDEDRF